MLKEDQRGPSSMDALIYAIEFDNGCVKVGFSANPKRRLESHYGAARSFGLKVLRSWVSPEHASTRALENEKTLIKFCAEYPQSKGLSREFFSGVGFDAIMDFAKSLTFEPTSDDEFRKASQRSQEIAGQLIALARSPGHIRPPDDYTPTLAIARVCQRMVTNSFLHSWPFREFESSHGLTPFEIYAMCFLFGKDTDEQTEFVERVYRACDQTDADMQADDLFGLYEQCRSEGRAFLDSTT